MIGKNNQLPWHLPADLKHFKSITMGKPIVMGRKTYESIGKPLPGRRNIVISRQEDLHIEGCEVFASIEAVLTALASTPEIMVIGGANLYQQFLHRANTIYMTVVDADIDGDAFFPVLDHQEWSIVESKSHLPDEKNKYPYQFLTLIRKTAQ